MVNVGDKVKDLVTGFTGIAIARTEWLNKCVRISVQPQELHEGKRIESDQFDEEQLEVLESASVALKKRKKTGGDKDFRPTQQTIGRR